MYAKIRVWILGLDWDPTKLSLEFYIFYTEFWSTHLPLHSFPNLWKLATFCNY